MTKGIRLFRALLTTLFNPFDCLILSLVSLALSLRSLHVVTPDKDQIYWSVWELKNQQPKTTALRSIRYLIRQGKVFILNHNGDGFNGVDINCHCCSKDAKEMPRKGLTAISEVS